MKTPLQNRRQFLARTSLAVAGTAITVPKVLAANTSTSIDWPIGCFNRPWGKWSYDTALDGIKRAGFKLTGLVGKHGAQNETLLTSDSSVDHIEKLKYRIAARGLKPIVAWIYGPFTRDQKGAVLDLKRLTDNAKRLGLATLLSGGPRRDETLDDYSTVMAEVAAYAADQGVKVAMKPHGGDGAEITRCLELVNHPNFSIWYDAGNIIYYTGGDPVSELKGLAPNVTGFCAKDCAGKGLPVMIQFGEGKADFQKVFQLLKNAGFNGPVMIECTGIPDSPEHATQLAIQNRDFLKAVFSKLE